jgi:zinc-ribbon domain
MKCPRCQHENEAGAKFCEECATPLARACSKWRPRAPHHRDHDVPRDGHDVLAGEGGGGDARVGMTLRIAAFILIPMMLLGVLLIRPHALLMMPSLLVDLMIGIIIILPILALKTWRSRKA